MSRIPAHGAVVVTTTISAVLTLCLLGGIAAEAAAGTANASTASPAGAKTAIGTLSNDTVSDDAASDDIVFNAVAASPLSSSFVPSSPEGASVTSSLDGTQSVGTTANIGLAGLAAEGQVPAAAAAVPSPAVAAPAPAAVVVQTVTPVAITGAPRDIARTLASSRGWSPAQWSCLDQLWQRESKFQPTIRNSRSGAYGIPQALPASRMASAGTDWRTNPVTQVKWGLTYISTRYGTGCNAWAHWQRHGWY